MQKTQITPHQKVDILLPYWGDFSLLQKAVDSVIAQTEKNWRLLIVDDCNPSDEAERYYSDFADERVQYIRNKNNLGLVGNYNYALTHASAKYCMLMGCDDIMLPNYIEVALLNIGTASYYQPGVEVVNELDTVYSTTADRIKKIIRPKSGLHRGDSLAASLCHGNWTYFPSLMWQTAILKKYGFDSDNPNTQDLVTQVNIICDGGTLRLDDTVTFQYRRSLNSFSSKAKKGTRFNEESDVYSNLSKRFSDMGWKKSARAARLHITVRLHQLMSRG